MILADLNTHLPLILGSVLAVFFKCDCVCVFTVLLVLGLVHDNVSSGSL